MPNFDLINNGDSGLSVRTTLNDVINYVNTGITSGSSFTYITEDTTPGSEFVNILSPRDVYISGGTSVELEYYGSPTITRYLILDGMQSAIYNDDLVDSSNLVMGTTQTQIDTTDGLTGNNTQLTLDGFAISMGTFNSGATISSEFVVDINADTKLQVIDGTDSSIVSLIPTSIISTVDDGTNTSTQTITSNEVNTNVTDGTDTSSIELTEVTLNIEVNNTLKGGQRTSTISINPGGVNAIDMMSDDNAGQTSNRKQQYNSIGDEVSNGTDTSLIGLTTIGWEMYNSDGTSTTNFNGSNNNITSLIDNSIILFEGTEEAYGAILDELKGELYVIIPDNSVASSGFFNISNNIVIYFTGDTTTFINIDINQITSTTPGIGNPGGTTRLRLNGSQGISNTYVGDGCYVFTPDLGGGGTEVIPEDIEPYTSKIVLSGDNITIEKITNLDTSSLVVGDNFVDINSSYGDTLSQLRVGMNGGDGNKFKTNDISIEVGTGISFAPDQSYQWAGDYDYTMTAYTENYCSGTEQYLFQQNGDYISQLVLDPASLNTGTLFKSEDLVVGSSTILSLGYDGMGSFDMTDGTGNSSYFSYTPSSLNLGVDDGSNSNIITLTSTNLNISNIPSFDDDASASGLTTGDIYQTTGGGASPLDVAGILMIKQ
jgi:hypothetical protein